MKICDMPTGDKGQRYKVLCKNEVNEEQVVGWTDSFSSACSMKKGIMLHPTFHHPKIIDRKQQN